MGMVTRLGVANGHVAIKLNKRGFSLIDMLVKICPIIFYSKQTISPRPARGLTNNIIIYLIII
jgi:hypothetical protein